MKLPDPGARGLQGCMCCGLLFVSSAIALYITALALPTWYATLLS